MEPIQITSEQNNGRNWTVQVQIGEQSDTANNYTVRVDEEIYERLTGGLSSPGQLVEETFKFLLEREPKDSIMSNFDLDIVSQYFPDYESEIVARL